MSFLDDVKPAGSCRHRPISNGWSQGWKLADGRMPAVSRCGLCRSFVEVDDEWIEKFKAAGKTPPRPADPTAVAS